MKKSKLKVKRFIDHLFGQYDVLRIPVYIKWHYPALCTERGEYAFGLFAYKGVDKPAIYVACNKLGTSTVLSTIAHEFVHYLQYAHGRDMNDKSIEIDAEYYGPALYGRYLINKKCNEGHIYEPIKAWKNRPSEE